MSNNVNSFTETTNLLIKQTNIALESLIKINESLSTQDDTVLINVEGTDPVTGDVSTYNYSIPSYSYTLAELNRIKNSVDTFISGQGVVLLNDGTYREVKTISVAKAPNQISGISAPSKFNYKNNWFFESLMFPQIYVEFNLKNKIDDRSDRIVVRRIIFDNFNDIETQWFKTNIVGTTYSYYDVITLLNENGKKYWIDEETHDLPLKSNKYTGSFQIIDKKTINQKQWFFLDTLNFGLTTDASLIKNIELKVGDQLRYNDSLYSINEIEITEKRVSLTSLVGLGSPTINNFFYIYTIPFEEKTIQIPIGYDECNIIFIKGVNDDYNILADFWGDSISFYSNDLTLINSTTSLETYYLNNVVDFGKQMEGQAKEKFIPAFYGLTPDAPTISADQFSVKQINTQLNAALDTESIKTTQTQIESTKTIINSLKTTIAQQKAELVELTDPGQRSDLKDKIDNNTSQLSKKSIEYQSLVRSLATLAYENNAVASNPKYRVRGFFDIPEGKTTTTNSVEKKQQIIQFEYAYRYLRLDNTGNPLNTYSYTDPSTGQSITGTFTDWTIVQSPIKTRKFDASTSEYVWVDENISDGEAININQIDIPITKGEKVQLKIRSISEAGWPSNPKKSSWSSTITIDFPSNIEGSDQVVNILDDAQSEETTIKLEETLDAAGVYTHIQDGVPNPNSADGTFFKHQAQYLAYDVKSDVNESTGIPGSVQVSDLQSFLDRFELSHYVTIQDPSGTTSKTILLQSLLQEIVNQTPSIYTNL